MFNGDNRRLDESSVDVVSIQREAVPDSQQLRASILAEARARPQHVLPERAARSWSLTSWFQPSWFQPRMLAAATCAAAVLVAVNFTVPDSQTANTGLPTESLSAAELDFQELMINEDELLFAQL